MQQTYPEYSLSFWLLGHRRTFESRRCFPEHLFSSSAPSAPIQLSKTRHSTAESTKQKWWKQRKANSASERSFLWFQQPALLYNLNAMFVEFCFSPRYVILTSRAWMMCQCYLYSFSCYATQSSKFVQTNSLFNWYQNKWLGARVQTCLTELGDHQLSFRTRETRALRVLPWTSCSPEVARML